MENLELENFIRQNSPDGGFLQSTEWRKFQEAVGRKTYHISSDGFSASVIEHSLPIVGKYFYVPRGPVVEIPNDKLQISNKLQNPKNKIQNGIQELIGLAKKNGAGWIRVEPGDEGILEIIENNPPMARAPRDVQPREVFVIDIAKPEEELLKEMKSKTRYNIRLAEKKGVSIRITNPCEYTNKNIEEFVRLTGVMARRQGIVAYPGGYYRKMFETIPGDILKLYAAEYQGKIIAANLVVFYGKTAAYLHGASDDEFRNAMAPFALQWKQIRDAKEAGCERYDFGGIMTKNYKLQITNDKQITNYKFQNSKNKIPNTKWAGITRFKMGFSPETEPLVFPGSYDIIINPVKYWGYRGIQRLKSLMR